MNIVTLLPFIVLIGAMFLMTRSAKKKQQKAAEMRDQMQPGTGVKTIGGMYATVLEVRDDAVLLEVDEGTHALYAKNAVAVVLEPEEYDRIVHGEPSDLKTADAPVVPDDASELTEAEDGEDDGKIDLGKRADSAADDELEDDEDAPTPGKGGQSKGDSEAK
ncbi:preprotein translocase subunit YajC [Streptomyces oceani]|uniref:Preprotein translocase, YajC subunit n=1 Tax=Streptomyces oceani TaxID=1075402 RepID=A0A1E7JYG5_9ACTN|nr:preprotein translocase subunit YajC [Streptomyces oceani]OEU96699.1 preprotein translocase, YajC subunit [Streptomyces oceani]